MLQSAKQIGAGLATIDAGVGAGIGIVFAALVNSFARNIIKTTIIWIYNFRFLFDLVLFALMMAFLILLDKLSKQIFLMVKSYVECNF